MSPSLSKQLIQIVLIFSFAIFALSLLLIVFAIGRRIRHEQDFKRLDDFRLRLNVIFEKLRDETLDYTTALAEVRTMFSSRFAPAMEQILLEHLGTPGDAVFVRRMAEDLGLVNVWRCRLELPADKDRWKQKLKVSLYPARFFTCARSAENLGRIRHSKSWDLLAQALQDPHRDVRGAALRALAAIGEPQSFPVLVEYLRVSTQTKAKLSERELRSVLARFPLRLSGYLLPLLHDSNPKLRWLGADILAGMLAARVPDAGEEEVAPQLTEIILTQLTHDADAEVRARAATLLSYVRDERASGKLRQLLNDEAWFVRLHAVRALGERRDTASTALLSQRLAETNWRVREAAARSLSFFGAAGVSQLMQAFLNSEDRYTREQIAEELELSGELARMVERLPECSEQGRQVLGAIIRMGKMTYLESALAEMAQDSQCAAPFETYKS